MLGSSWQTHDSARGDSLQFRGEGQPPGEDTPVPGFGFRDAHTFSSHTFFSRRSSCVLLRENSRGFPPPPQPLQCFWEPASPAWTAESDHKTMKTEPSGGQSLLPQTGRHSQDIKECSMTSEIFQKGIKNEGVSPAGKTGSLTTAKRAFFLQRCARPSPYSTEQAPLPPQALGRKHGGPSPSLI